MPTATFAEVCDKTRPSWDPTAGPATSLTEAAFLLSTPFGLATCGLFLLAILTRSTAWLVSSVVITGGLGMLYYLRDSLEGADTVTQLAMQEGCVGPTTLAVAICFGFCFISAGHLLTKRNTGASNA